MSDHPQHHSNYVAYGHQLGLTAFHVHNLDGYLQQHGEGSLFDKDLDDPKDLQIVLGAVDELGFGFFDQACPGDDAPDINALGVVEYE